ncbi:hypothetical protein C7S17_6413 [Burkholderia thailandensis]|nr:hypothetical protein [Burkholderia thailandensis]
MIEQIHTLHERRLARRCVMPLEQVSLGRFTAYPERYLLVADDAAAFLHDSHLRAFGRKHCTISSHTRQAMLRGLPNFMTNRRDQPECRADGERRAKKTLAVCGVG